MDRSEGIVSAAVVLVACGKAKAPEPRQAAELYTGQLTQARIAWARRFHRLDGILSAKHGLLDPSEIVAPYDLTLYDLPMAERRAWARATAAEIERRWPDAPRLVLLAGEPYGLVEDYLPGWHVQRPRHGGIGYEKRNLRTSIDCGVPSMAGLRL